MSESSDVTNRQREKKMMLFTADSETCVIRMSIQQITDRTCLVYLHWLPWNYAGGSEGHFSSMVLVCHWQKIPYRGSVRVRSCDFKDHGLWFASFSYSSNHSMTPLCPADGGTTIVETTPIRKAIFHRRIEVIIQNKLEKLDLQWPFSFMGQVDVNHASKVPSSLWGSKPPGLLWCLCVQHKHTRPLVEVMMKVGSLVPITSQTSALCFMSYLTLKHPLAFS